MSVTKWIHYHHGDEGIATFFRKVYAALRPGGIFILEPQPWKSYKKKQNLTTGTFVYANAKAKANIINVTANPNVNNGANANQQRSAKLCPR